MNANYKSIILAISLFFALATSISAAPGDLDPTFGNGGIVITKDSLPIQLDYALGMAIQSDGKIVVVGEGSLGTFNWDFAVVRYNTDGSLDSSFGGTGIVITQLTSNYDGAFAVAIQADGKIIVAGTRYRCFDECIGSDFAVVRYNPNGSLDTSFNGTGIVITSVGSSVSNARSVAIQADGKIVVAGGGGNASNPDFALVRYNTDGSLDTSFNGTGKVITPAGSGAGSVAIQADGKIIAVGGSTLVRYNPDGTLDTSFNGTGKVSTPIGSGKVAIQSDGKIVAAGSSHNGINYDFTVVRYNSNGSLDSSFGGTGQITIPVGNSDSGASSVAIQRDGKIVAAGGVNSNNIVSDFAVVRLNPSGSLDTTFNGTGKVITPATAGNDIVTGAAIQADGKIVVAGMSDEFFSDFYDFVVVRYQGDDATPAACPNPIDCAHSFVRQHYLDFLFREPEPSGMQAWLGVLNGCPNPFNTDPNPQSLGAGCDRITVSAAFFQSPEFSLKGFYAFRFYKAALNRLPAYEEITADMGQLSGRTDNDLFARRAAFAPAFAQRQDFRALYDPMTNAQYVAALLGRYQLQQVRTEDPQNPEGPTQVTLAAQQLADALDGNLLTRAQVLRAVVQSDEVDGAEYQNAFVAMQYYGYLRRTPEPAGYEAWLRVIRENPNNIRLMVNGFINSQEYRRRFGQP